MISASRRTDIPAFYSQWFVNRIREGYVRWMNPFSKAVYQVSLLPEDVSAIVFWSKDYQPLPPYLDAFIFQPFQNSVFYPLATELKETLSLFGMIV